MVEGRGPVQIPREVLEQLEAVRRDARTDALDIPTLRYAASEEGKAALVVWIDGHPGEYARGVLDGFGAED